jgi:hypothetical protein
MIFEFIRGNSLTTLAQDALKNKNTSYRLYTKADLSNTSTTQINKRRTQAVIYQIVHIQYMLNRLLIKGKKYNFYHADLNTGNVMVRDVFVNASLNAGFGPIEAKNQPLVTFIDFGHSTSDFDSYLGANVNNLKTSYHKTLHIFSDSTAEFYKNLNGSSLNKATEFFSGLTAINSDMRLYLIMARAIYDSLNYTDEALMKHLKDCNTRTKCVEKAPPLFKAVK